MSSYTPDFQTTVDTEVGSRLCLDLSSMDATTLEAQKTSFSLYLKGETMSASAAKMPTTIEVKTLSSFFFSHLSLPPGTEINIKQEADMIRVSLWRNGRGPVQGKARGHTELLFSALAYWIKTFRGSELTDDERAIPHWESQFVEQLHSGVDLELRIAFVEERLPALSLQKSAKEKKKTQTWKEKREEQLAQKLAKMTSSAPTAPASAPTTSAPASSSASDPASASTPTTPLF